MSEQPTDAIQLSPENRERLKSLSAAFIKMHKCLLDDAKADYESRHGKIMSVNVYFQLVIDDAHFAWLRKISSMIALIDETTSLRRPGTEQEAAGLFAEAETLLGFRDGDEDFNTKFSAGLMASPEASKHHTDAVAIIGRR